MTDRELLELAAKAVGLDLEWCEPWQCMAKKLGVLEGYDRLTCWHPIKDDGDALRLAVKARLTVCADGDASVSAHTAYEPRLCFVTQFIKHCQDKQEATRRAIVRAAAKIGKAML